MKYTSGTRGTSPPDSQRLSVEWARPMRAATSSPVSPAASRNARSRAPSWRPRSVFRFRDDQDVATVETRGGDFYLEDIEPFAQALRRLTAATLSQRKSVALIAAVRRELT